MLTFFLIGIGAGLANTAHCLGMCGGFPVHLGFGSGRGSAAVRQSLFVVGKSFTYVFLGGLSGAIGVILLKNTPLALVGRYLPIGAGLLTILFGLVMLGIGAPRIRLLRSIAETGLLQSVLGGLLTNPSPGSAFALGLGVGFIPCPLPIAMLVASAGSHSVLHGMLTMAGVGIGTAPGLMATGLLGAGISRRFAKPGMRVAGVAVLVVGILTIGRATGVIAPKHPTAKQPMAQSTMPCCGGEAR